MRLFLIVLSCVLLSGCRSSQQKADAGTYLVIGCEVYDLEGNLKRSYPGVFCIFQDDGSVISYDATKMELTKYDRLLKKQWGLKRHFHHYMTLMNNGNLLVNSSMMKDTKGYKKVRLDQVMIINQEGKILNTYTFQPDFSIQRGFELPMKTKWDENLDFNYEFSHLAASDEVEYELPGIPSGSIILTFNSQFNTTLFMDANLSKIIDYQNFHYPIHDAQVINNKEIMMFRNNRKPVTTKDDFSGLVIYDIENQKEVYQFSEGSFGIFGGSVQKINEDIFLMSDMASKHSPSENFQGKSLLEVHLSKKSRITLLSRSKGIIKELHFKTAFNNAKVQKLEKFLQNNIGP